MFRIADGRECFYQWDLDREIIVEDATTDEIHFCNKTGECSLVVEVYEEDGVRKAKVPNILLQTDWDIRVYGYCGGSYTKQEARFKVASRSKPADYIYTETEIKNYDDLEARVEALEENSGGTIGGGDCVVYLEKDAANYEIIKAELDKGKEVIITYENRYYQLQSADDYSIMFRSVYGERDAYILDFNSYGDVYDGYFPFLTMSSVNNGYDPLDSEPISGQGVAAALANYSTGEKEWTLLNDITLTEAANIIDDGSYDKVYEELWIEGVVKFETDATSAKTGMFFLAMRGYMSAHCEYWGSISNGSTWYLRAHGYKSPSGKLVWDTLRHTNYYVAATPYQTAGTSTENVDGFNQCRISIGADGNNAGFRFGAGTKFKVWGR